MFDILGVNIETLSEPEYLVNLITNMKYETVNKNLKIA